MKYSRGTVNIEATSDGQGTSFATAEAGITPTMGVTER